MTTRNTIRNIDPDVFTMLKAHAAMNRQPLGEFLSEAARSFLTRIMHQGWRA